ncbi:MAG: accessory Sec system protein Asp2 [Streptococcus sp.]|nr:accessory Sec system protein Asp2 [Streptococcus sp.]
MQKIEKMQVLQVGYFNWAADVKMPENIEWNFYTPENLHNLKDALEEKEVKIKNFSAIVLDDLLNIPALFELPYSIEPYTILYNENTFSYDTEILEFVKRYQARAWDLSEPEKICYLISRAFYNGQYGDKQPPTSINVHHTFSGEYFYNGNKNIELRGEFGSDFQTLLTWRYNQTYKKDIPLDMWLEYEKEGDVEILVRFKFLVEGSLGETYLEKTYTEEDLKKAIELDLPNGAYVAMSLEARGEGILRVGDFHARYSRLGFGNFLLGGEILSDSRRQEVIAYFHPGDLKPPLNVYFSGFRPAEGFEGYFMMRSMNSPFILIGDPRLEGGSFYMGSDELENKIRDYIQNHLDYLGFSTDQLTLSGLSMGTFGALYYGADFNPHAIVVGKPLVNVGDIALNLKLKRPEEFGTSLDMMKLIVGESSPDAAQTLNQKFWDKFHKADFSKTILALAYMRDDDYDQNAYHDILESLYNTSVRIISKSRPGRHNDASAPIIEWFFTQYKNIMESDFGRELK